MTCITVSLATGSPEHRLAEIIEEAREGRTLAPGRAKRIATPYHRPAARRETRREVAQNA